MSGEPNQDTGSGGSRFGNRRLGILVVTGVLAVNLLTFGALAGAGALPFQFSADDGRATDDQVEPLVPVTTEASSTVSAVASSEIPGFLGAPVAELGAGALPIYPCSLEPPVKPTAGAYRAFASGSDTVAVTVSAYGAGAGGWVLNSVAEQLRACGQSWASVWEKDPPQGIGVDSVAANVPAGSAVAFRRGDVLVHVVGPNSAAETVARQMDTALADNLDACLDPSGAPGDESRNPWLPGVQYAGMMVDSEVKIPSLGAPLPPPGIPAVPLDAAELDLPFVQRPSRPADPVWPAALPAELSRPSAPTSPGPEPTKSVIKVPQIDRLGPGCGWAFTASSAPIVSETEINDRREQLRAEAVAALSAQQQQWRPAVTAFYQQWAAYRLAADAYRGYATEVAAVASAWQKIVNARVAYEQAMRAYNVAVAARDAFLADQRSASEEYQLALAICAQPLPEPTPEPSEPDPSASPGSSPSTAPSPSASPTSRPGCPAERPAILDEQPPSVPALPSPPPDPRPASAR